MYRHNMRVFSSPPVFRQGYSPHAATLCVLGEPIAGIQCSTTEGDYGLNNTSSNFETNNRERRFK